MSSHNSFQKDAHFIFSDVWKCYLCGSNRADCLHHIVGRGSGESIAESSLLNAGAFCNQKCHLPHHGELRTKENVTKFLNMTYDILMKKQYQLNEVDTAFLEKYADYY